MQKLQLHSGGGVKAPEGLILALASGYSLPDGWNDFSDANGFCLKGTDSNALSGTSEAATSISYTSGSGGSHDSGPSTSYIKDYGQNDSGEGSWIRNPSWNRSSVGGHSHPVSISYTPSLARVRLVRSSGVPIKEGVGLIGLALSALEQTRYTFFDGSAGIFSAGSSQSLVSAVATGTISNASDSHNHVSSVSKYVDSLLNSAYTGTSGGGGSHGHTVTPTISETLAVVTAGLFLISNAAKLEGLVGMWLADVVPDRWELDSEFTDRFVKFSTPMGVKSGDNKISISGGSSNGSHSHGYSGGYSGALTAVGLVPHGGSVPHSHSISSSGRAYQPARFHVKFIKYVG